MKTYLLYLICSNHLISLRVQQRGIFKTHVSNKIKRCVFNSRERFSPQWPILLTLHFMVDCKWPSWPARSPDTLPCTETARNPSWQKPEAERLAAGWWWLGPAVWTFSVQHQQLIKSCSCRVSTVSTVYCLCSVSNNHPYLYHLPLPKSQLPSSFRSATSALKSEGKSSPQSSCLTEKQRSLLHWHWVT